MCMHTCVHTHTRYESRSKAIWRNEGASVSGEWILRVWGCECGPSTWYTWIKMFIESVTI